MSENTKIEWADHTFNPWIGCTKVGPGCDNCYAEAMMDKRLGKVEWGAGLQRQLTSRSNWALPLKWNKNHEAFITQHGRRQRVFCASLADVFDNEVDDEWRIDLACLIMMTPHLDWLLLTKRIGNVRGMVATMFPTNGPPPNMRFGATFVNQTEVDRDWHKLTALPWPNFASIEPLLGYLLLPKVCDAGSVPGPGGVGGAMCARCQGTARHGCLGVDWVIVGGESGPGARPMHPDWARSLRDQCAPAGVPFLFKQWGEWLPDNQNPEISGPCGESQAIRVGKKAAGRHLDGIEHNSFPQSA